MVIRHEVHGYDNFSEFMKNFDSKGKNVHIYFGGSKKDGISWCPDCVRAYPVVQEALKEADPESHFIMVDVGDRETWKDPNCRFRKDQNTRLMVVPTLIRWKAPQRLEGEHCENMELVEMLLSDDS